MVIISMVKTKSEKERQKKPQNGQTAESRADDKREEREKGGGEGMQRRQWLGESANQVICMCNSICGPRRVDELSRGSISCTHTHSRMLCVCVCVTVRQMPAATRRPPWLALACLPPRAQT